MSLSIINGRLIDPAHDIDDQLDLHVDGERVVAIGAPAEFTADEVIDARGKIVCPGLVDLAASLREPGYEHKGTLATETAAAASLIFRYVARIVAIQGGRGVNRSVASVITASVPSEPTSRRVRS